MIFGRPANLWLGAGTALLNLAFLVAGQMGSPVNEVIVAAANIALAAIIALIAGQPPTLAPGDTYNIQTLKGQPNYEATVATPPKPTTPEPIT